MNDFASDPLIDRKLVKKQIVDEGFIFFDPYNFCESLNVGMFDLLFVKISLNEAFSRSLSLLEFDKSERAFSRIIRSALLIFTFVYIGGG